MSIKRIQVFIYFYDNNVSTPEHQEKGIKYCFHKNQSRLEREVPTSNVLSMPNPDYKIKMRQAFLTTSTDYTAKMGKAILTITNTNYTAKKGKAVLTITNTDYTAKKRQALLTITNTDNTAKREKTF